MRNSSLAIEPNSEALSTNTMDQLDIKMSSYLTPTPGNWTRWEIKEADQNQLLFFESFDTDYWYQFQSTYWWVFWLIVGSYWVGVYSLRRYMDKRDPLNGPNILRVMLTYNTLVTLFSLVGLWRISTTFFPIFFEGPDGFYRTLCTRFDVTTKDGFWLLAFGWSKVAHLLDTFFTVLRKKPVQFIQMYHHSVVVLVPQHILPYGEPILIWWGISNLAQHAFTYPYFAFKVMKIKVPKFASTFILILEVVQMLLGLGTGIYTLYVLNSGGYCVRHPKSILIMYFVYASMTILAMQMAYDHFSNSKRKPTDQRIKSKSD